MSVAKGSFFCRQVFKASAVLEIGQNEVLKVSILQEIELNFCGYNIHYTDTATDHTTLLCACVHAHKTNCPLRPQKNLTALLLAYVCMFISNY
jgi:hypothetical protein